MSIRKIYIKNMVAQGTRKFVLAEMKKLGLKLSSFIAGELNFKKKLSASEVMSVEMSLKKYGLELMFEKPEAGITYALFHPDFEAAAEGINEPLESENFVEDEILKVG